MAEEKKTEIEKIEEEGKTVPSKEREIFGEVVLRSQTGESMSDPNRRRRGGNPHRYLAHPDDSAALQNELERAGFRVVAASRLGVSIAGSQALFEKVFATRIVERTVRKRTGKKTEAVRKAKLLLDPPRLPLAIARHAERVFLPQPGWLLEGEGPMPTPDYYHLRPPEDIARLLRADEAHARGYRGAGIRVGLIDTGFYATHDYYTSRGYNITVHAATGSSEDDEIGHGTAIASNLLAIAPDCEFHAYKAMTYIDWSWAVIPAFRMAVADGCQVISCSWTHMPYDVLEEEIRLAVSEGVTVVFGCGNKEVAWPGCMEEVISVGGAYPREDGGWEASTYASSGEHPDYPWRTCPDVSGIVGHEPEGILIIMPTSAGSWLDGYRGDPTSRYPLSDLTEPDDGWAGASGTSSSAPQVAGAAVLMLEARPGLPPDEIRRVLRWTCTDVTSGFSASGHRAQRGWDVATGAGVIDIGRAVEACAAPIGCPLAPIALPPETEVEFPWCARAPVIEEQCLRAPLPVCRVAPVLAIAPCAAGPSIGAGEALSPAVVFVPYAELQRWRAIDLSYARAKATLGLRGEFNGFPEHNSRSGRAFYPEVGK